jgi:hypothetical protein
MSDRTRRPEFRRREREPGSNHNTEKRISIVPQVIAGFVAFCVVAFIIIMVSLALTGQFDGSDTTKDLVKNIATVCPYNNGDTVRCPSSTAIWKIENGAANLFTGSAWKRYGNPIPKHDTELVCKEILKCRAGALLDACPYDDGDIVRCPSSTAIWKIENGLAKLFTAASWARYGNPIPKHDTEEVCKEILRCPSGGVI